MMGALGPFGSILHAIATEDASLPAATHHYGWPLLKSLLALTVVCFGAWWILHWAARRGFGQPPRGQQVRVLERIALDTRRALYLIEVGSRRLLLGGTEQSLTVLAELKPEDLSPTALSERSRESEIRAARRFKDILAKVRSVPAAPPNEPLRQDTPQPPSNNGNVPPVSNTDTTVTDASSALSKDR